MDKQNLSQQDFNTWANAQVLERKLHLSDSFIGIRYGGCLFQEPEGSWELKEEEEVDYDLLEFYGC
jgi:hypothetical protein